MILISLRCEVREGPWSSGPGGAVLGGEAPEPSLVQLGREMTLATLLRTGKGQRKCSTRTQQSGTWLESWNSGNSEHSQGRNTFPTKTAQDCSQGPGRLCCREPWRLSNPGWAIWFKLKAGSALGRVWTGHLSWFSSELLCKPMSYSTWSISAAAGPFLAKSARVPCHGPLEGQVWWEGKDRRASCGNTGALCYLLC